MTMTNNLVNLTSGYVSSGSHVTTYTSEGDGTWTYDPKTNTCKKEKKEKEKLTIKDVIYHDPATIVYFSDGSKEVVKVCEEDEYDEQTGLLMCIAKKYMGKDDFHKMLKKYVKDY